jgi:predicted RNA-binding Zn-ribbon protein involved in translation (DUF1610 family)
MDERDHKAMNEELNEPSCLGAVMPSFDDIVRINQGRFISQTTHFICAKCGGDTPLSNRELLPLKTELVADKLVRIYFPCPKCDETYDIGLSVLS